MVVQVKNFLEYYFHFYLLDLQKLSSSIARLQLRIPAEQLSYLSIHLPDVDIAKNAIEEYRNTPSLHVELLDSALDPTAVAKTQKAVLNKLADALQAALVETVKNTMESIFSNLKPAHGKEFCSVHPRAEELIQKVQPLIDSACASIPTLLDQIVMPMVLSVNAKLVQQMYTYMLEAITTDVQNCLKKVPERSQLVCRSTVPSNPDEYFVRQAERVTFGVVCVSTPGTFAPLPLLSPSLPPHPCPCPPPLPSPCPSPLSSSQPTPSTFLPLPLLPSSLSPPLILFSISPHPSLFARGRKIHTAGATAITWVGVTNLKIHEYNICRRVIFLHYKNSECTLPQPIITLTTSWDWK
ncbi:unnamed protein product [Schistocephalus solidus]|uniref:BPI1 domain-containing protein n=1 Tax=Schistocephalus solidus TaxID=70667 RepID=A0A183TGJ4_SCHSO|nr:unnamed protein product [Schistocephalus solidus]